jgi:hypothetical protein
MTQRVYDEMMKRLKPALENNEDYLELYGDMTKPAKNVSQYLNYGDILRQMYADPALEDMKSEIWEAINEVAAGINEAVEDTKGQHR